MATEWFYGDDNEEQQGPITLAVLREKYASGEIRGDTLLWNEDMDTWEELDSLQELVKKLSQPPPPPKRIPSIAPPSAPTVDSDPADSWVVVSPQSQGKKSPVVSQKKQHEPIYTDDGEGYNSIGLKTTGYRDGEGGRQDQYTPGWALDDDKLHSVMQDSTVSDDLARTLNITQNPKEREATNNLGLRTTSRAVKGSMYGDYTNVGGENAGGRQEDCTVDDVGGTSSRSLHRDVMEGTGIRGGMVKEQRKAAFGGLRGEEERELGPGVKLVLRKSKDNNLDVIYSVVNSNSSAITATLDFEGSEGVELREPVLPSGGWKVVRTVEGNEESKVAHVVQIPGRRGGVRLACSVKEGAGGVGGSVGGNVGRATVGGRRKSITVAEPERKQLAPNLFLLKQKISSPLGYCYSIENGRTKDYELTMDFAGSKNVRLEGEGGGTTKVKEVVPPGDIVVVATVVQADLTAGISVKTKMGVRELGTISKSRGGKSGEVELKGPAGSGLKRCVKPYRAKDGSEMDVDVGDEVFLQGGNAGGGDGFVVGVNARSGATGLVPAECLEDAVGGVGGGTGSYNNVYRKGGDGGWEGGKGKVVQGMDVSVKRPPAVPSKKRWEPRAQAAGMPQPVGLVGMGREEGGGGGLVRYATKTYTVENQNKTTMGMRVDPRSGKVTTVKPGEKKSWVREEAVVRGYER
ncbi:hypothetical protein TrCOL_g8551 [Triparma columacea]|uniref:SH3 domain-containing protein n=1 Tax=Triparma columacea TaxID=722753 RepID=A0A9W7L8G4_9STRA|nr:hypothetical protein TrCOL_g8551 [Triparma columacea]